MNYGVSDPDSKPKSVVLKTPLMPLPYKVSKFETDGKDGTRLVKYSWIFHLEIWLLRIKSKSLNLKLENW